jgi:DNA-binding response OmpR family regulator
MRRILILDDEPLIAMMVEDWLTEIGCEAVGPANSVASALRLVESEKLDGAILDVSLGGENSYSVADALRTRGIPFTFVTGRGADGVDSRFEGAPVLAKPFDFDAIKRAMSHMLDS